MSTGAMLCTHCGRPAYTLIWVNGRGYHEECLKPPAHQAPVFAPLAPFPGAYIPRQLTEDDVRRIVREEIARDREERSSQAQTSASESKTGGTTE